MYKPSRPLGLSLLVCFVAATPLPAALTPADLRCEYAAKPLAIESPQPRLSWILHADPAERGQRQTAYRVLVASSPDVSKRNQGDLWDSGRAASDRTIHVVYAGRPLASSMRCHWKVQVWDAHGRRVAVERAGNVVHGPLAPRGLEGPVDCRRDAAAQQGRHGAGDDAAEGVSNRRPDPPGDDLCDRPWPLRASPERPPRRRSAPRAEWTRYSKRLQYQAYDATELLRPGANCIAATLGEGWWAGPLMLKAAMADPVFRLLLRMEIERADGSVETVVSDPTWQGASDGPIRRSGIYFGETYDATKEQPGWDQPGFKAAWRRRPHVDGRRGTALGGPEQRADPRRQGTPPGEDERTAAGRLCLRHGAKHGRLVPVEGPRAGGHEGRAAPRGNAQRRRHDLHGQPPRGRTN